MRTTIRLTTIAALLGPFAACASTPEERQEARTDSREDIREARQEKRETREDQNERISDAREERREKIIGMEDEEDSLTGMAANDPDIADEGDKERWRWSKQGETRQQFVARAEAEINHLESDLRQLDAHLATVTSETRREVKDELQDVREALAEARKDTDEVEHATEELWGDGRAGVGRAINKARRSILDARDELEDKTNREIRHRGRPAT